MQDKTKNKYATYTQSQRLDMIKGGNTDVYNNEKASNERLRSLRKSLGLSTEDIDEWDKTVDMAANTGNANGAAKSVPSETKNTVPVRFSGSRVSNLSNRYNDAMQSLVRDSEQRKREARLQAEKDIDYLVEYLVNNGYSSDGKAAREGEKEIRNELKSLLRQIQNEYLKEKQETREMYLKLANAKRTQ